MAKKKQEPQVYVPASVADAKWINTPFAYARLSKDLTLLQQNVLLKVSDQLQGHITQFFLDKRHLLSDDPNSLFTPEVTASLPRVEIRLSDFGIDKTRYGEIHVAASAVSDLRIKAPNIEDDGTVNGYRMFPVFDEVVVPKTDETASDEDKYNYRTGVMYASINPKVAAYAFNMRLGYINHPMQIAQDAGQVYSPRIYFLIKHYLPKGKSVVNIPYDKIREELGMIVVDRETGDPVDELYPQYSRFRTYVLDKAKEDIDNMAKRNLIDITFTYEPCYKGNANRGNPESITFKVELTELGKYHKQPNKARTKTEEKSEEPKRRGRPRKDSATQTELSFNIDYNAELLDSLRQSFGNGVMGYDYYFGKSASCEVGEECVIIKVPASVVDTLSKSAIYMDKIRKCVLDVVGKEMTIKIE